MKIDLEKLIKKYGGKWVALDEELGEVVANGEQAKAVFNKAKKNGVKIPFLFKVPVKLQAYIGRQ